MKSAQSKPLWFMGRIYRIWLMRHVNVPDEVARELQRRMANGGRRNATLGRAAKNRGSGLAKYIPVVAIVNGKSAQTTLVPAGGGRFRMQVNTALRKAARVDEGEVVSVKLRLDRSSRELPVPADLRAGLKQHRKAERAFKDLGPGHRRHLIQWFDAAKSVEARKRRLERAIDHLLERALLRQR
jgi:hypothetical protein